MSDISNILIESLSRLCEKTKIKCLGILGEDNDRLKKIKILIAEDDKRISQLFDIGLQAIYEITIVESLNQLKEALNGYFTVAILDEILIGGLSSSLINEIKQQVDMVIFFTVRSKQLQHLQNAKVIVLDKPDGITAIFETLARYF